MPDSSWPIALTKCYFCGEGDTILISTRQTNKHVDEADGKVIDMIPCSKCRSYMEQGVIIIAIDESKSGPDWFKQKMPNPYRTGGWWVVTDEAIARIIHPKEMADWAIEHRWMFAADEACRMMGLYELIEEGKDAQSGMETKET